MAKAASVTPMMQQYLAAKEEHPDKILFFRMGDFYEMFFEDARVAARELGLTLTSRDKGENPVPMAGAPHHQCDRYVRELLAKGYKVAICDQLEDPAQATGIVKRGITRLLTPGTVVEDHCLQGHANNFLAAVCLRGQDAGLAFADVSTGEFCCMILTPETLADELERLAPAETLLPRGTDEPLLAQLKRRAPGVITERDGWAFEPVEGVRRLKQQLGVSGMDGFGLTGEEAAVGAAAAVLAYLEETQRTGLPHILTLRRVERSDHLVLDRATQRNLELVQPLLSDGKGRTLLAILDRTRTGPGGRLLKNWLLRPLCNLTAIHARQQAVGELMDDALLRSELREMLAGIADIERIMARIVTGRANARDIAALGRSAQSLPLLKLLGERVTSPRLRELTVEIDPLEDLAERIATTLVDDPPVQLKDGRLIRDGVHAELDELRGIASGGKDWLAQFQASEQERTGIPSLKIGFNRVFGYYIEITNAHRDKAPAEYERKQTLVNAERYVTPELKTYEAKVLGAEDRIGKLEYELFAALRDELATHVVRVQTTARALAELDALTSLAEVGASGRWILPEVHDGLATDIRGGRHPVIEHLLSDGEFVPNDLVFKPESGRLHIITGPNMAGKSTYIRQAALLVILAQMGAPVPATSASIGLTDRVFTRVGAADDLSRGQSTFMVEMAETANILNNASERSLVILDEVGRGTSTFDGVSLAWAITEYLHHRVQARTLFATHYHELAELGQILERAENRNVAVRDWGGEIIFLHKIQPGACDRSYGLQVARLAGVPNPVVERAQEILAGLESQAVERDYQYTHDNQLLRAAAREVQGDLFAPKALQLEAIGKRLQTLDADHLSPAQAHQLLRELTQLAK